MLVEVFDPVLCCASGVCGPRVDPVLVLFAADLRWLQENGCPVRRFNLGQNPAAFVQNETVRAELNRSGESALPLTLVDGRLVVRGRYPTRAEMRSWLNEAGAPEPAPEPPKCGCEGAGGDGTH